MLGASGQMAFDDGVRRTGLFYAILDKIFTEPMAEEQRIQMNDCGLRAKVMTGYDRVVSLRVKL
eukprot:CAMPEP_0185780236 /NCGR_PEP_ID=MMETSP1174-20130828/98426_1 /TAXON_ID=35687 /ORGANISM="Dictyocha speculum, Strain CCMP1381" /LENGTH=63 /DNA_ID=CAMNT_0028469717 /DNA_START=592 /DNA_END=783 /DNA_ORIENTATION=-